MSLDIQIYTILISFSFGVYFFFFLKLNKKLIFHKNRIFSLLYTLFIFILNTIFYFCILLKINDGIFHIYEILCLILGYMITKYIIDKYTKLWYNLYGDDMRKKKIPKASKKRLAVFGTLSIIIIFYFLFILGFYVYRIYDLKKEKQLLEDNYTSLKTEEKELRNEIEKLQDPDYIARYARENYSYSKDGEYIIKLKKDETKSEETDEEFSIDYSLYMYGSIVILILIIIHVIRKKKN